MDPLGAIGVIDSGVGGLTAARELVTALPNEDILYLGDSKNCPYGNRSREEILSLTLRMLEFLRAQGVKCVAIACNTISTLVEELRPQFDFPIVSIVECAVQEAAARRLKKIGLIATCFTVSTGAYQRLLHEALPDCSVFAEGSANLANLVDLGDFTRPEIDGEIRGCVEKIRAQSQIEALILGCTHYPIVEDHFRACYPDLPLLNPAAPMLQEVRRILQENGAENPQGGRFRLYTTGEPENYLRVIRRLGFREPDSAETLTL